MKKKKAKFSIIYESITWNQREVLLALSKKKQKQKQKQKKKNCF